MIIEIAKCVLDLFVPGDARKGLVARHVEEVSKVIQRANLPVRRLLVHNPSHIALQIVPFAGLEHAQNFDTLKTSRDIPRAKVGFVAKWSAPVSRHSERKSGTQYLGHSYRLGRPLQSVAAPPSVRR